MAIIKARQDCAKNDGEKSFTLIETVIAVALLGTIILEAVGAMGNMVHFSGYSRKMTEGIWLAKRIMSQVEYQWSFRDFKDMEIEQKEQKFADEDSDFPFTYQLTIKEGKFPILDLLAGGGAGGGDQESGEGSGGADPLIKDALKQVLGDHILKVAHVMVFWPEGAKRNSVELALLLTNQREIDNQLVSRKQDIQKMMKKVADELKPIEEGK